MAKWQTGQGRQQLADPVVPHLCADKLGGTTGERERLSNPWFQHGKLKPQNLWLEKPVGVEVAAGGLGHPTFVCR